MNAVHALVWRRVSVVAAAVVTAGVALAWPSGARELESENGATFPVSALSAGTVAPRPRTVRWRMPIGNKLTTGCSVDSRGNVLVATTHGDVVSLDGLDGHERWRASLGGRRMQVAPLASGRVATLSSAGEVAILEGGQRRRSFAIESVRSSGYIVALADGGFVIAADQRLLLVDRAGVVRSVETLPAPPAVAPVAQGGHVTVALDNGLVVSRDGSGSARTVARLGGRPTALHALSAQRVGLVVDARRVVVVDTMSARTVMAGEPAAEAVVGGPAPFSSSYRVLVHVPGRVLAVTLDAQGNETARFGVATLAPRLAPDGGLITAPPDVVTAQGARGPLAAAIDDSALVAISRAQGVVSWGNPPCTRRGSKGPPPVAGLAATADGALAVACADGSVSLLAPEAKK